MTKLVELVIGSGAEGYQNTNMEVLSVGANNLLRKLDIRNCPNLKQAIDLALCTNIREIWAEGTGTSAVVLPEGGNLTLLHLPNTITNLTVRNQTELTDAGLVLAGVQNLSTIRWENTNKANVLSIIDRCFALDSMKLERVRLIGVDWNISTLDIIAKLIKLKGLDENGNNTDKAIVSGKCYVSVASQAQLAKINAAFPELTITYGQLKPTPVTTFTFSSSQSKILTNSVFTCNVEFEKVSDTQYKVAVEDGTKVEFTYQADNHELLSQTYTTAGTRTQSYKVTYIPVRKIRVKVYNQSTYVQGASVVIGDQSYISDKDGYVTLPRSGAAVSGSVSAYGYAGNTFSFSSITSDTTNTIEIYAAVDVKFIVKYGTTLIEGATVKSGSQTSVTNQYGECVLSLGKGAHDYTVTHPDYFDMSGTVTVGTSATTVNVTMELNIETLKPIENGNIQMLLQGPSASIFISSTEANYVIDWGDGEETPASGTGSKTYNHTYTDAGSFQVEVKNHSGITYCRGEFSCLIAYWSIGNSAVKDLGFQSCSKLKYFGDVFKNDSNRTSAENLFYYCSSLTSIDLSPLKRLVNVTSAANLLNNCYRLTSVDLTPLAGWTKVTSASGLLEDCSKLTSVNLNPLAGWVNITHATRLLSNCSGLTSIDLTPLAGWVNVTNADSLLSNCYGLTSVDFTPLAGWVNVTNANSLLTNCYGLTSVDFTPLDSWVNVTSANSLLYRCIGLTSVDLTPLAGWVNVISASYSLYGCSSLTSIDLTPLAEWVKINSNSELISSCKNLIFISILANTPFTLSSSSSLSNGNDCPIYVPDSAVDVYKTATNWSSYSSRIKPISEKQ